MSWVPQMNRTEANPKPRWSRIFFAAAITSGWSARPRVRRQRTSRFGVKGQHRRIVPRQKIDRRRGLKKFVRLGRVQLVTGQPIEAQKSRMLVGASPNPLLDHARIVTALRTLHRD